jgi:predicted ester cyclase
MSPEQNKELVRRYIQDVWGKGDYEAERELVSPKYIDHNAGPGMQGGLTGHHTMVEGFHKAFSSLEFNVELLVAQGDKVVDHWTGCGRQTGVFMGIPPTAKEYRMSGTDIVRLKDGKIVETWHVENMGTIQDMTGWNQQPAMAAPSVN